MSKGIARTAPALIAGGNFGGLILVLVSLGLLLFSSVQPQAVSGWRSGFADAFVPVLSWASQPFQNSIVFVRDISGLATMQAENAALRQENAKLREWYQAAMALQAENKDLRALLNIEPEAGRQYVTARVLSDAASTFAHTILVSAGKAQGVDTGQAVISGQGVVGRTVEVGRNAARVLLVTDMNARVPVLIEDSGQHAIMAGGNSARPTLVYLDKDSQIPEGARVITSGKGGVYPYGLPVGRIVRESGGAAAPEVVLFADLSQAMHVRIIDSASSVDPAAAFLEPAAGDAGH